MERVIDAPIKMCVIKTCVCRKTVNIKWTQLGFVISRGTAKKA